MFKDVFPRFKTMQGCHVPRRAGWDCHGLPVEIAVEKELGFTGKHDIEGYGIAEFNASCRESVLRHVDAFAELTERMGYWVDMSTAYRTMDPAYVESVWWSLKQIFDKGLLVEDHRVTPYCPRCGTGLSDHEVAQGYETVADPSVYVRFPVTSGPWAGKADLLVWTTTPWTLVSNTAVAVHPDVTYVVAPQPARRRHRSSSPSRCWRAVLGRGRREVLARTHGPRLGALDLPAAVRPGRLPRRTNAHYVVLADYVTTEDGTGPGAPGPRVRRRRPRRHAAATACRWSTRSTRRALPGRRRRWSAGCSSRTPTRRWSTTCSARLLFRELPYEHSYPHCWRCHTPLIYYALPSWYIRTTADQGPAARREREDQLVPGDHQARPLRRLAEQQRRLGAVPQPLLGHPAADLAQRRRPVADGRRRLAGRARGADRPRPVRPRPAPAVRRRRHLHPARRGGHLPAGPPGHRRLVRLGLDAVRPVGRAAPQQRGVRGGLPGAVHLRGDRPDPRLVLHADGGRHAGVRPVAPTRTCSASATSWPRTAAR